MRFDFELDGIVHSLYFGMASKQIVEELSVKATANGAVIDDFAGLCFLVHSGRCNFSDTQLSARPTYTSSYEVTEALAKYPDVVQSLYDTWKECEAGKDLLKQLPQPVSEDGKKKGTAKKSQPTGTK